MIMKIFVKQHFTCRVSLVCIVDKKVLKGFVLRGTVLDILCLWNTFGPQLDFARNRGDNRLGAQKI